MLRPRLSLCLSEKQYFSPPIAHRHERARDRIPTLEGRQSGIKHAERTMGGKNYERD
jgi:hypothetical protein